ncbi:MAG: hypothetical protein U9M90_02070 [Patescibacteria group bacterium]|nr:hypothetical protein [Patescibacteria group bacterium]
MDKKNVYFAITVITIIILLVVVLSIAVTLKKTDEKLLQQQVIQQKTQQEKQQKQDSANKEEEIVPKDQIEFSDPGNDELGQEVEALDSLINQTLPSEYNEKDLSSDKIENEVQPQ